MRAPPARPFDSCDVDAAMEAAVNRVFWNVSAEMDAAAAQEEQTTGGVGYEGLSIKFLEGVAAAFRYLTPKSKLQEMVLKVMDKQASSDGHADT